MPTTLALFDLDNTLLASDSDYEWGQFLVKKNLVDPIYYEEKNNYFYQKYQAGELNIHEYSAFAFEPLSKYSMCELEKLHQQFMEEVIKKIVAKKTKKIIQKHRAENHTLIIITATNSFITRPIANFLNIPHLIATEPEIINDRYTTSISGTPCFQEGKVRRLYEWLKQNKGSLKGSYFYSDSHNDLPLLNIVDYPVAVDPDEKLERIAVERKWKIMSLR